MLPLILTLMLGTWEIGRAIELTATLNAAAREGARMAAGGVNNGTPVTVAMVQAEVQNYLHAAGFPAAAYNGTRSKSSTRARIAGRTPARPSRWTDSR